MALIMVQDARVTKVFQDGKACRLEETQTIKGQDIQLYYTVWFGRQHGLNENDRVSVKGVSSHRPGQFEIDGKTIHTAEVHINQPEIMTNKEPEVIPVQQTLDVLGNAPF